VQHKIGEKEWGAFSLKGVADVTAWGVKCIGIQDDGDERRVKMSEFHGWSVRTSRRGSRSMSKIKKEINRESWGELSDGSCYEGLKPIFRKRGVGVLVSGRAERIGCRERSVSGAWKQGWKCSGEWSTIFSKKI